MQIKSLRIPFVSNPNRRLPSKLLLYLSILFIPLGCGHRVDVVSIEGQLASFPKSVVYLNRFDGDSLAIIDSVKTDRKGNFDLVLDCKSPYIVSLNLRNNKSQIVLVVEPDQEIRIFAEGPDLTNYSIRGSEGSILICELNSRINKVRQQSDSLNWIYKKALDNPKKDSIIRNLDSVYNSLLRKHRVFALNTVKNNPYSLASILVLYQSFDSTHTVFDYSEDKELFKSVDKSLLSVYSSNSIVKNFHSKIIRLDSLNLIQQKREMMFKVGEILPDASFQLVSGESFYASSIWFRYILIDFWADWCPECKSNTDSLRKIYKEYNPKGLVILQVSIDSNLDSLKSLIQKDTLSWYHAYIQDVNKSRVLDTLRISSIPASYITDRRGNIKAVNLTGEALKSKLMELFPIIALPKKSF